MGLTRSQGSSEGFAYARYLDQVRSIRFIESARSGEIS